MGQLLYGPSRQVFSIPDALPAHLQFLVSAKLRRNEPFFVNWTLPRDEAVESRIVV